jgi:hypothetical protein
MLVVALPEGISSPATHMAIGMDGSVNSLRDHQPPLYPAKWHIE